MYMYLPPRANACNFYLYLACDLYCTCNTCTYMYMYTLYSSCAYGTEGGTVVITCSFSNIETWNRKYTVLHWSSCWLNTRSSMPPSELAAALCGGQSTLPCLL